MIEHKKYQFIAITSGILTILAFSHLVFRVHSTKYTDNLTYTWILLVLSAQSLLMVYGFLNKSYFIYLQGFIILVGLLYILYIKMNNLTDVEVNLEKQIL
jgi:uncharacterized protein with PQ loop repeat